MATVFATRQWAVPSFSDDPRLRLAMGTLLYLAQGFPQGVVFYAIPTWLAVHGQGTATVGAAMSAASLPWSLKLFAGALMDRYTWLPMGRRRPWLVGSQALILLAFVLFALLSPPVTATALVIGFSFSISMLAAVQDTALDALVIDLTPDGEQGRLNGFMFGGKLFGIAGGSAVAGTLMEHRGIDAAMLAMAVLFAIPALAAVLIRERPGEKLLPGTRGHASPAADRVAQEAWWPVLRLALATLLRRDTLLVVGLLILYGVSQTLGEQGSTFFMIRHLGWGETAINTVGAIGNIVFGLASLLVGGPLIDRYGPRRVTLVTALGGFVSAIVLVPDPGWWGTPTLFLSLSVVSGAFTTLFYLSYLVLAMRVSTPEVAATSFALIMALNAGGGTIAGALLAPLEAWHGLGAIFAAAAVLMLVAGLLPLAGSRRLGRVDAP